MTSRLEILERHAPIWTMLGSYRCSANGCFFLSHAGEHSWNEFAAHLDELISNAT